MPKAWLRNAGAKRYSGTKNLNLPKALPHSGTAPGDTVRVADLLTETALDRLEETVIALKRDRSPEIVRKAMVERIARAAGRIRNAAAHLPQALR